MLLLLDLNKVINRSWVELGNRIYHLFFEASSNGRTRDFGSLYLGSNPGASTSTGQMVERLNTLVLKTGIPAMVSGVRIPLCPPPVKKEHWHNGTAADY